MIKGNIFNLILISSTVYGAYTIIKLLFTSREEFDKAQGPNIERFILKILFELVLVVIVFLGNQLGLYFSVRDIPEMKETLSTSALRIREERRLVIEKKIKEGLVEPNEDLNERKTSFSTQASYRSNHRGRS
jgi:hypothetical protein